MKKNINVVIGRFETVYLHKGHIHLLSTAQAEGDILCIVLGTHGGVPTTRYPLDIPTRTQMIKSKFPHALILSLKDAITTEIWSQNLDKLLIKEFENLEVITLYGSRDSFLTSYTGKCKTKEVQPVESESGTELRANHCRTPVDSEDFRKGMIYAVESRYPIVFAAIDIVIYRIRNRILEILCGERDTEGGRLRFIGGISDPIDQSFDETATREFLEEVKRIKIGEPMYVCSMKIDDHRYEHTPDGVMTTLFIAEYISGKGKGADDIDRLHWIPFDQLSKVLVSIHHPLIPKLRQKFEKLGLV